MPQKREAHLVCGALRRSPVPAKSGAREPVPTHVGSPRPSHLRRGRSRSAPPPATLPPCWFPLPVGVVPLPPRAPFARAAHVALTPTLGPPWSAVLHTARHFPPHHPPTLPRPGPGAAPSRAPRQGSRPALDQVQGRFGTGSGDAEPAPMKIGAGPPRGLAPTAKKQKQKGVGVWGGGGSAFEPSQGGGRV